MTLDFNHISVSHRALMILDEKIKELLVRERVLAEEMTSVASERKAAEADKGVLEKAQAIQDRVLGHTPRIIQSEGSGSADLGGQMRARIGRQRYAMLATLRLRGRLDVIEIAHLTGLNVARVREQMRSDQPTFVMEETLLGAHGGALKLYLTDAGKELLKRFEAYRMSQGRSLPPLVSDDGQEDEEIDPAHSKSAEAGAQGPYAEAREAGLGGGT